MATNAAEYAQLAEQQQAGKHHATAPRRDLVDLSLCNPRLLLSTLKLATMHYDAEAVRLDFLQGKGLQVHLVDKSNSSMVDALFPCASGPSNPTQTIFRSFYVHQPYLRIWVAPKLLSQAIRTAADAHKGPSGGVLLRLRVAQEQPDRLVIETLKSVGGGGSAVQQRIEHSIALIEVPSCGHDAQVDGSQFEFTHEMHAKGPEALFAGALSTLASAKCDTVTLELGPAALHICGTAEDLCSTVHTSLSASTPHGPLQFVSAPEPLAASFRARHVLRLLPLCDAADTLLLQMGKDAPLSVTFELQGGAGAVQFFIAPLVDEGSDGGGGNGEEAVVDEALQEEGAAKRQHVEDADDCFDDDIVASPSAATLSYY